MRFGEIISDGSMAFRKVITCGLGMKRDESIHDHFEGFKSEDIATLFSTKSSKLHECIN